MSTLMKSVRNHENSNIGVGPKWVQGNSHVPAVATGTKWGQSNPTASPFYRKSTGRTYPKYSRCQRVQVRHRRPRIMEQHDTGAYVRIEHSHTLQAPPMGKISCYRV